MHAPASPANCQSTGALPWIPLLTDGVSIKVCKLNPVSGDMVILLRFEPNTGTHTHYHHGTVAMYMLSGELRYRGHDRIVNAGDVIYEQACTTHSFDVVGDAPAVGFAVLDGALELRDANSRTLCVENAETLWGRYLAHCALNGIEPQDIARI